MKNEIKQATIQSKDKTKNSIIEMQNAIVVSQKNMTNEIKEAKIKYQEETKNDIIKSQEDAKNPLVLILQRINNSMTLMVNGRNTLFEFRYLIFNFNYFLFIFKSYNSDFKILIF